MMTQYVNDSSGIENFRNYYSCYFNKYFNIDPETVDTGRDDFVSGLLESAMAGVEIAPTLSCVEWICDPALVWDKVMHGALEVWAYYALHTVQSWQHCLEDEKEEFARKNYTSHAIGVYAMVTTGDGGQRLFYVPSTECYLKGEYLVESVVKILVDKNDTINKVEDLLQELYEDTCENVPATSSSTTKSITTQVSTSTLLTATLETTNISLTRTLSTTITTPTNTVSNTTRITTSGSTTTSTLTKITTTTTTITATTTTVTTTTTTITTTTTTTLASTTPDIAAVITTTTGVIELSKASSALNSFQFSDSYTENMVTSTPSVSQTSILILSKKNTISKQETTLIIITIVSLSMSLIFCCCWIANTAAGKRVKNRILRFLLLCLLEKLEKQENHHLQVFM